VAIKSGLPLVAVLRQRPSGEVGSAEGGLWWSEAYVRWSGGHFEEEGHLCTTFIHRIHGSLHMKNTVGKNNKFKWRIYELIQSLHEVS